MASFDHMASVDPWIFSRPNFGDWFTEAYSRETESLTKALQQSISSAAAASAAHLAPTPAATTTTTSNNSNNSSDTLTPDVVSPFLKHHPEPAPSPPAAAPLGSDQEAATASKRQRVSIPGASGKVSKRKSRASKRSQTTYITADPANFRQMVQQVTGVRFVGAGLQVSAPILKPEPQRPGGGRLIAAAAAASGCLPTLDTSAFLLDHHAVSHHNHHHHQQQQQQQKQPQQEMAAVGDAAQGQLSFLEAADVVGSSGSGGFDFGSFAGFPTLESWTANAM